MPAAGDDLSAIVDAVLSTPLARDRPLWEMWIADALPGGRIGIVGKAHHCMVDGTAIVELGKLLLDAEPDVPEPPRDAWAPAPAPSAGERFARGVADRAADALGDDLDAAFDELLTAEKRRPDLTESAASRSLERSR